MVNASLPRPVFLSAAAVVLAVAVGVCAVLRYDLGGERGSGLPVAFRYDRGALGKTDPSRVLYRPAGEIAVPLREARAVAVGPADRIVVTGDRALVVFEPGGAKVREVALTEEPRAVAVGHEGHAFPGRTYVALKTRVEVRDPEDRRVATWDDLGPNALLTSVAVAERDVLVADAGQRVVHRYDPAGRLLEHIGGRDQAKDQGGFIIPSPCFDVAVSSDGLVRVANPGKHRIEGYTFDGHFEVSWGRPGESLESFCGCCNPANFALLRDGRFVTAEKGILRVKVYSSEGQFLGVVAGAETWPEDQPPVLDVAADGRGRVLVLDPRAAKVRIYEAKE
jgi:hypothetical protein